jgi:L-iditol 2-dehydrogenase
MKVSVVTAPGETRVVDAPKPTVGPADVLVKIRACGICGTDALFISMGGIPGHDGGMPSPCPSGGRCPQGHEPAGEVVDVGVDVTGIAVGDHVVINPMAAPSGIIGNGGTSGALSEYLLIENAERGRSLEVVPDHIPFEVAALNEPMAVARHDVNRCQPKPSDKVVVFGAGPIGLGATIAFKSLGVSHVVVADLIPAPLEKALQVGADAVINSAEEDVALGAPPARRAGGRLLELHGAGGSLFPARSAQTSISTPRERPQ